MKLTPQAAGTFAIAPTPFHDDGRVDERSIDRLTDFYAEVGCDGVTVLGILGEYLGAVFDEVKHRPLYIIDEVIGRRQPNQTGLASDARSV